MKQKSVCTFEVSDTVSQLPPVKENFPDPIRSRISSGVSFGPLANGVYLTQVKTEIRENKQSDYKMHFISFHFIDSTVYSCKSLLQRKTFR